MLVDLWQHSLLLRPLLVFVLAGPLLVLALLARWRGQPRHSKRLTRGAPEAQNAVSEGQPEQGPRPRVDAGPQEWPVSAAGSDRRAA
jgi:hypothetical protein